MRSVHSLIMTGLVFGLVACGSSKKGSNDPAPAPSAQPTTTGQPQTLSAADKASLDAKFSQIPQAAIVRVPVDASGNANGVPEMHTYTGSEGLASGDSAAAAFNAGAAPQNMVASASELDNNTSTQSWTKWNNYVPVNATGAYYGNTYGNTYGNSYAPTYGNSYTPTYGYGNTSYSSYYGGWNNSYWTTSYKPTLYWQGIGWNYGYYQPYNYTNGGYSYHCYRPYKYW